MTDAPRIDAEPLLAFAAGAFEKAGMPQEDARLVADSLVQADLWGHQSHGAMRIPWYAARLKSGAVTPACAAELVVDAGAVGPSG